MLLYRPSGIFTVPIIANLPAWWKGYNGVVKNKPAKICTERGLKWVDALPLALMSWRAGLSPPDILTS